MSTPTGNRGGGKQSKKSNPRGGVKKTEPKANTEEKISEHDVDASSQVSKLSEFSHKSTNSRRSRGSHLLRTTPGAPTTPISSMNPADLRDTVQKLSEHNVQLEQGQIELREMLLAFSTEKGLSNSENSMRLGGGRGENPRASLASSLERDNKGIGVKHKEAIAPASSLPAPVASAPAGPNSSFAEIAILDELAQSMARSGMDSRGSGDIHIKHSVVFSDKLKEITPKTVIYCLRKVIQHMSENPSQPGLVASEICTDSVRDIIMNENSLTKIGFSQLTALAFLGLCSKEAAAKTDVQYVNKLRSVSHWPGRTWHLLKYDMSHLEHLVGDLTFYNRSFADTHEILAWKEAEKHAPKMGGGKYDRPAYYRNMIPNGLGGILHRLFEKEFPAYDYKSTTMDDYAAHLLRILREKFLQPAREYANAQELLDTGPTSYEGREYIRLFRKGGTAAVPDRGHDRSDFDRHGGTGRTGSAHGPTPQQRQHWAPSTMHAVDEYNEPIPDHEWGDRSDYPNAYGDRSDDYVDRSDDYGDRSDYYGPDDDYPSNAPYGYVPQHTPEDSGQLSAYTPTPMGSQACNYHMKGNCHLPGIECQRSHDKVVCQPQAAKDIAALLYGPYGPSGAVEALAKAGIPIVKPPPREPRPPPSSAPYANRTMYGNNRGLQPPLKIGRAHV